MTVTAAHTHFHLLEIHFGRGYLQEGVDVNLDIKAIYANASQYSAVVTSPDNFQTLFTQAIREVSGTSHRLPSGPLHDAAEVARAGVPTVMLFVQSLRGLSHTKEEDTKEEHIAMSVEALDKLATKAMKWIVTEKK